jgi:hypothetical protein
MTQMREQSRQIAILSNAVSQLAPSITKPKRKLIVMSSSEDPTSTDSQRAPGKRVVKSTKRAQTTRIETARAKRAKIHEKPIESPIPLISETKHFESRSALFVNKHVSSQSDHLDLDPFTSAVSTTNLSISDQSSSESLAVDVPDLTHGLVPASASASVPASAPETEPTPAHQ